MYVQIKILENILEQYGLIYNIILIYYNMFHILGLTLGRLRGCVADQSAAGHSILSPARQILDNFRFLGVYVGDL